MRYDELELRDMSYLLLWTFVWGFIPRILAQAVDYETTPEPVEPSSFTCQGRAAGYYADLETGCKTYHVCDGANHFTYTCPERTLFQQRSRICDHSYLVRCEDSVHYYEGDVYQDLDEDDFEEDEEEGEDEGVDYEYASNKEEVDDFEEEKEELTPTPEIVKTTSQEPTDTTAVSAPADTDPPSPPPPTTTTTTTTETSVDYSKSGNPSGKTFLKFSLKDPRWMFYIPEVEKNSIETRRTGVRELVLPLDAADKRMRFKAEVEVRSATLCPRFCNPRFLVPGTCHPCIMIK